MWYGTCPFVVSRGSRSSCAGARVVACLHDCWRRSVGAGVAWVGRCVLQQSMSSKPECQCQCILGLESAAAPFPLASGRLLLSLTLRSIAPTDRASPLQVFFFRQAFTDDALAVTEANCYSSGHRTSSKAEEHREDRRSRHNVGTSHYHLRPCGPSLRTSRR